MLHSWSVCKSCPVQEHRQQQQQQHQQLEFRMEYVHEIKRYI